MMRCSRRKAASLAHLAQPVLGQLQLGGGVFDRVLMRLVGELVHHRAQLARISSAMAWASPGSKALTRTSMMPAAERSTATIRRQ